MLNFIAVDLQLYKIFKNTRVSFFWDTVYIAFLSCFEPIPFWAQFMSIAYY